jgi:hypothetical protein
MGNPVPEQGATQEITLSLEGTCLFTRVGTGTLSAGKSGKFKPRQDTLSKISGLEKVEKEDIKNRLAKLQKKAAQPKTKKTPLKKAARSKLTKMQTPVAKKPPEATVAWFDWKFDRNRFTASTYEVIMRDWLWRK